MDESNLKQWWLNSYASQKVEVNIEKLLVNINQKMIKMEKAIKRRDRLEITVAACMIPLFVHMAIKSSALLAKTGAAIIAGTCILVIFRLIRARRISVREDAASTIRHQLLVSLQQLNQQIQLVSTVLWWYLLPFFVGVTCLFYSASYSALNKAFYTAAVMVLYGYIYYLNRKTLKKHLIPLQVKLTNALDELSLSE